MAVDGLHRFTTAFVHATVIVACDSSISNARTTKRTHGVDGGSATHTSWTEGRPSRTRGSSRSLSAVSLSSSNTPIGPKALVSTTTVDRSRYSGASRMAATIASTPKSSRTPAVGPMSSHAIHDARAERVQRAPSFQRCTIAAHCRGKYHRAVPIRLHDLRGQAHAMLHVTARSLMHPQMMSSGSPYQCG